MDYDVFNDDVMLDEKQPANGLGIAGFVVAIFSLLTSWAAGIPILGAAIGLALSILGKKKENARKGLANAGLVISIIAIFCNIVSLSLFCLFGAGILFPQIVKYQVKSQQSQQYVINQQVEMAILTAIMDPAVVTADDNLVAKQFSDGRTYYLSDIPDSSFRDSLEKILGVSLDDPDYSDIKFSIDGFNVTIY